jgi:hemerythrin-like domain-containing protein
MSAATNVLLNEHRFLGKMLDFAQDLADRMRRGEDVKPEALGRVAEFLRICLEGCLLTKEEDFLLPALARKGLARQGGPIALMLIDHERGRRLVHEMAKAAADYEAGNTGRGNRWAVVALDFVDLMRAHLREEESTLFTMADIFLRASEQAELAEEFKKLEETRATSGRHRLIHQMPEQLPEKRKESM